MVNSGGHKDPLPPIQLHQTTRPTALPLQLTVPPHHRPVGDSLQSPTQQGVFLVDLVTTPPVIRHNHQVNMEHQLQVTVDPPLQVMVGLRLRVTVEPRLQVTVEPQLQSPTQQGVFPVDLVTTPPVIRHNHQVNMEHQLQVTVDPPLQVMVGLRLQATAHQLGQGAMVLEQVGVVTGEQRRGHLVGLSHKIRS